MEEWQCKTEEQQKEVQILDFLKEEEARKAKEEEKRVKALKKAEEEMETWKRQREERQTKRDKEREDQILRILKEEETRKVREQEERVKALENEKKAEKEREVTLQRVANEIKSGQRKLRLFNVPKEDEIEVSIKGAFSENGLWWVKGWISFLSCEKWWGEIGQSNYKSLVRFM
jgi:hypothetical protein